MAEATCDVETLARWLHDRLGPAGGTVAVEGPPYARVEALVRTLRPRVAGARYVTAEQARHADAVDVRVWMDDPGGILAHLTQAIATGAEEPGRWSLTPAVPTEVEPVPPGLEHADLVFATVEGFDSTVHLRFMAEVGVDFALWDDGNEFIGELERLLPLPEDLRTRVRRWVVAADRRPTPGSATEGLALSDEVQRVLGDGYRIEYLG